MAAKLRKYIIVCDRDGDAVIWALHSGERFTRTSLVEVDIAESDTPIIDLRD